MSDDTGTSTLSDPDVFAKAREIIDAAHREDPAGEELGYADNMEKYLRKLVAPGEPTNVQVIAARCQHLRRFLHPRSTYPAGKPGYLQWRRDLYTLQANYSASLLSPLNLPASELAEISDSVSKKNLLLKSKVHPTTILLEDAAVLVFLSSEVQAFSEKHEEYDEEKWVGIVSKIWRKLSSKGKEEAGELLPELNKGLRELVEKVVQAEDEKAQSKGE